jgi:glycosyltransferase involved in cell wall biosynthesis
MKLAILAQAWLEDNGFAINGTSVQLHNLAKGFAKQGIEVHYIAQSTQHNIATKEEKYGIIFHWIPVTKGIWAWKKMMSLYSNVLNEVEPNAIYVRGRNVLQFVAGRYAQQHQINFVWGTNGDDSAEFYKNVKRLRSAAKPLFKKMLLAPLKLYEDTYINCGMQMATHVVNQSEQQQEATRQILKKEGVVIPSYFLPEAKGFEKENILLWLATLSPKKQPHLFVELVKNLKHKEDWKAILGGGSNHLDYAERITKQAKPEVECIGKVPFTASNDWYAKSKIYINTSLPEADGLPNAYIQSWLNGTIVLSLHHDPNHWMEKHQIGYCANGDFQALQDKLQHLINHPHIIDDMSINARKFAEQTFANHAIIEQYKAIFFHR